jgi:dUTP pyrophosphatase
MVIKIKRLTKEGVIPSYSKDGDAGMDLTATKRWYDNYGNICYGTDISIEIPEGYEGEIRPRSSISKYEMHLINSPGTLDSNYRGEVIIKFRMNKGGHNKTNAESMYEVGDRVAQLLIKPAPHFTFEEVDELSETNRGEGGFGSTGS